MFEALNYENSPSALFVVALLNKNKRPLEGSNRKGSSNWWVILVVGRVLLLMKIHNTCYTRPSIVVCCFSEHSQRIN